MTKENNGEGKCLLSLRYAAADIEEARLREAPSPRPFRPAIRMVTLSKPAASKLSRACTVAKPEAVSASSSAWVAMPAIASISVSPSGPPSATPSKTRCG